MDAKPISAEAVYVGQNIRRERRRLRLTGEDVRRLASIDPTSLSLFERGLREPNVRHLRRLAEAFRVPLAQFFRVPVVRRPRSRAGKHSPKGSE